MSAQQIEKHNTNIADNATYIIIPMQHLQVILKQYLWQVGAIDTEQKIDSIHVPIETDDEDNITLKVWSPITSVN